MKEDKLKRISCIKIAILSLKNEVEYIKQKINEM